MLETARAAVEADSAFTKRGATGTSVLAEAEMNTGRVEREAAEGGGVHAVSSTTACRQTTAQ